MIVDKIDFMVEIIDAKDNRKEVTSDQFYEVAIKRNNTAKRIPILMREMEALRDGQTLLGDDIHLIGMKIRRLP